MHLILTGFKGVGKSFLGKRLAERLQRPFIDSDLLLMNAEGEKCGCTTIRELYLHMGEEAFRKEERRLLRAWLTRESAAAVVATGGGTLLDLTLAEECAQIGKIVCLEASLQTLVDRKAVHPDGEIAALYHQRQPIYKALPATHLSVDNHSLDELIDLLCFWFKER